MKNNICFMALLGIMLIISPMPGCGGGEEHPKKAPPEPASPNTAVEQKPALPAENDQAASLKTGSAQMTETKATESGKVTDSQRTRIPEVTEVQPSVQEIADVIVIENKVYTKDTKYPVKFNHIKHNKEYGVSCDQCHHVYVDDKNTWKERDCVEKCVICHDPAEKKDKVIKLQNAFHQNCRYCHTAVNKEGKKAPDKKCADCHGN